MIKEPGKKRERMKDCSRKKKSFTYVMVLPRAGLMKESKADGSGFL